MGFKPLLGDIFLWLSAISAILGAVDLMLLEKQKRWIKDKTANLWIWLDDQKSGNMLHVYLRRNIQKIARIIIYWVGLLSGLGSIIVIWADGASRYHIAVFIILFLISMFVTRKYLYPLVVQKLSELRNIWQYALATLIGTIASVFVSSIIAVIAVLAMAFSISENDESLLVFVVTIFYALSPITSLFMVLQMLLAFAIIWICIAYILMGLFKVVGFFTLRVAENSKGTVFAVSMLLGTIGGIIKVFL